jgi:hypothetical protein
MGDTSQPAANRHPHPAQDAADPWRRRMWKTAERLRLLDARRFENQIAIIEECLRRDAGWNLEAALASCDRWRAYSGTRATAGQS